MVVTPATDRPDGAAHDTGVQPLEVSNPALAPAVANSACILVFCPVVNIYMHRSSVDSI